MDWFSYLVAGILVYVAVVVFIAGTIYRIYKWSKIRKSKVKLGMFPKPKSTGARWFKLGKDTLIFPQVLDVDVSMWIFVMLLHIGGIGIFFGHLRLFGDIAPMVNAVGENTMEQISMWAGGTMGIILLIAAVYFIVRRFKSPYRDLSVPEDYLMLLLILLIILFGDHLRFFSDFHLAEYREYIDSLLAFSPSFPQAIAESGAKWVLVSHVLTANILLIYFPFSKLVHSIGGIVTNLVRSEV